VELFEAIRQDADRAGFSIRALSEKYGVYRRTVRALACSTPPPRKKRTFPALLLDPVKELIDDMLREDLTAPRKQPHTARRVLARLVDEQHAFDVLGALPFDTIRYGRVNMPTRR
jgi:hypothetical protein